jgi:hypothetical protein
MVCMVSLPFVQGAENSACSSTATDARQHCRLRRSHPCSPQPAEKPAGKKSTALRRIVSR